MIRRRDPRESHSDCRSPVAAGATGAHRCAVALGGRGIQGAPPAPGRPPDPEIVAPLRLETRGRLPPSARATPHGAVSRPANLWRRWAGNLASPTMLSQRL